MQLLVMVIPGELSISHISSINALRVRAAEGSVPLQIGGDLFRGGVRGVVSRRLWGFSSGASSTFTMFGGYSSPFTNGGWGAPPQRRLGADIRTEILKGSQPLPLRNPPIRGFP